MKLNADQVAEVEQQTGAKPIPEEDESSTQLAEAFGDHTFYADPNGLHVLEALPPEMEGVKPGMVAIIQIAEWTGDDRRSLTPVEPKALGSVLTLETLDIPDAEETPASIN